MPFVEDAEGSSRRNDPHAKPPESIKHIFKHWRKTTNRDLSGSSSEVTSNIFLEDPREEGSALEVTELTKLVPNNYEQVLTAFCGSDALKPLPNTTGVQEKPATAFEVSSLPGMNRLLLFLHLV